MNNGFPRKRRFARSMTVAILLASVATPVLAIDSTTTADAQPSPAGAHQEIIVTAPPLFPDIQPERNLDQTAIESYGASTVDELLGEIQSELGDDEEPLILINGERLNNLDDIGAYPIEVLKNLQVLPRGSAVRAGGTSGQRVISLTLNRKARSATVTVAPKYATDGGARAIRGEGMLTYIRGPTRANFALRGRDETSLLESERGIVQPLPFRPFALGGNVIGFPDTSGEIDPVLSALAGEIVTLTPVPAGGSPSLADFVTNANDPAVTDVGRFRTLRPNSGSYELNGSVSTRLAPWLTSTATLKLTRSASRYLRGLPGALFVLSASNPASPFSNDTAIAVYGADPLGYRSRRHAGEANVSFNAQFGKWTANLNAKLSEASDRSVSDRSSSSAILLDDDVNPFTTDLSGLIPLRTDRTSARSTVNLAQLSFTGPAVMLPAGPLQATIEGRLAWNRLRSRSTFSAFFGNGNFHRNEQSIRGAVDVPFTSRANNVLPQVGDIDATAEYSRIHYSDAGSLDHYAFGLTWEPIPILRLRGSIEQTRAPPSIQVLGNPAIVTSDVRVFDPLTGETVDVSQITGGNSLLLPQKTKIQRLSALVHLIERLNLQLNAEYTDTDTRNFVSSLPDASAAIMLAFPDRFIRDPDGVLTTVDLRPVNFASDHEKRLRWGLSMNAKIAGGVKPAPGASKAAVGPRSPTTYLQLSANHTVVFSDRIVIRSGLDPVDLLGGGAIGIGGGRLRHQVDGTAAITSGGLGARIGVTWRGPSTLESRIGGATDTLHFSPVFVFNLRAFTDVKRAFPHSGWAKGMRLSLDVVNLTNDRQRVRDSFGKTPLQYQPGYRDPIGRTIEVEIRKVF